MAVEFFVNGAKADDIRINVASSSGASTGSAIFPSMGGFKVGDMIEVTDGAGDTIASGTILRTTTGTSGTELTWGPNTSPWSRWGTTTTATSGGMWYDELTPDMADWPADDIIDWYARDLAQRFPA